MNSFEIKYNGNLRTSIKHVESDQIINTDAPKDNHGLGQSFSPTDLVCVSLGSCMITIMAIAMRKHNITLKGVKADVKKIMKSDPRMISQIDIIITFPKTYNNKIKLILERSALNCPVHNSLSENIKKNVIFNYL